MKKIIVTAALCCFGIYSCVQGSASLPEPIPNPWMSKDSLSEIGGREVKSSETSSERMIPSSIDMDVDEFLMSSSNNSNSLSRSLTLSELSQLSEALNEISTERSARRFSSAGSKDIPYSSKPIEQYSKMTLKQQANFIVTNRKLLEDPKSDLLISDREISALNSTLCKRIFKKESFTLNDKNIKELSEYNRIEITQLDITCLDFDENIFKLLEILEKIVELKEITLTKSQRDNPTFLYFTRYHSPFSVGSNLKNVKIITTEG